ncbi:MAG: hypothetical protein ACI915_002890 [Gammaproteobacteria bacterium]|jgi:hypothetical protein
MGYEVTVIHLRELFNLCLSRIAPLFDDSDDSGLPPQFMPVPDRPGSPRIAGIAVPLSRMIPDDYPDLCLSRMIG